MEGKRIWCHACSAKNKAKGMKFKCPKCNKGLCAILCGEVYGTKLHFGGPAYTKLGKWSTETQVNIINVRSELIVFISVIYKTGVHIFKFLISLFCQ